jgi:hypothetical protein
MRGVDEIDKYSLCVLRISSSILWEEKHIRNDLNYQQHGNFTHSLILSVMFTILTTPYEEIPPLYTLLSTNSS